MAGTNRRRLRIAEGPAVILVEPQLGENIGTAARAMLNCGLGELRLVVPRDGWPNDKAITSASGADIVLNGARLFPSIADAMADLRHVYAATARNRHMVKRIITPDAAATEIRAHMAAGETCGILFGPERTGLTNDQASLAETVITVPLNPAFSSLNLAQAVLLLGYEWFKTADATPAEALHVGHSRPATQAEFSQSASSITSRRSLIQNGFLRDRERSARAWCATCARCSCARNAPTRRLRTLHGVVTAFAGPRRRQKKVLSGAEVAEDARGRRKRGNEVHHRDGEAVRCSMGASRPETIFSLPHRLCGQPCFTAPSAHPLRPLRLSPFCTRLGRWVRVWRRQIAISSRRRRLTVAAPATKSSKGGPSGPAAKDEHPAREQRDERKAVPLQHERAHPPLSPARRAAPRPPPPPPRQR